MIPKNTFKILWPIETNNLDTALERINKAMEEVD